MSMTARAWECVAIDLNGVGVRGRAGGALGPWCGSLAGKIDEASKLGRWVRGAPGADPIKENSLGGGEQAGVGASGPRNYRGGIPPRLSSYLQVVRSPPLVRKSSQSSTV